jgi:hypothetical protein
VKPIDLGDVFYSKITNIASGKNVSLNTDGGVNVVLNANSDAANQTWKFVRQSDGSYEIINQGNGFLLNTSGGSSEPGTNINTRGDENLTQQRWFIYLKEGNYILQPACASGCLLTVAGGSYADGTNVQNEAAAFSEAQMFSIISNVCGEAAVNSVGVTDEQMEVLRKIMYAVETGGQVYGNADYDDFTEAYTNTSQEHAITIGAGQWYGPEAKTLLNRIRSADPALFASLDTAGVAADLDSSDWSSYRISKTSAKAKCIVSIISTDVGKAMQDQLIDEQMIKFMQEAKNLGVTDINALMMCANIRHLGGLSALKRILNKTATPYTLENICVGMSTDTGNQVGAPLFQSRHDFVVKYLNKYIPAEPVAAEHSFGYIKVESYATCGSAGLTFYLCNNCNMVKKEITPPTGDHAWVNATCTVAKTCSTCGLTEGAALGHSHKAVVTAPTCNDGGYTTYTCVCGDSYIADQVSARGHSYVDGICVNCGVVDPDYVAPVVVPTLTGAGFSLSFESEILVNFYYTATNTDDVMEQGMLVFYTDPTSADIAKADDVYTGSAVSGSYFVNTTRGIAAKEMGDSRYYCAFAKLSDGTYAYSPLCQYSPKKYATNMLANGTASAGQKALCVAMLNYGAAAQSYFGYRPDDLMNAGLTAEQQAMVIPFDAALFNGSIPADENKVGAFAATETGFGKRGATVSFEGAFAINYYYTPTAVVDGDMTMYVWTPEAYAAAEELTAENASDAVVMELQPSGMYWGQVAGIAAKKLDKTYYVAVVYTDAEGNTYCSGVFDYSLSKYCMNNAQPGKNMQELAAATAMYGYYAAQYFNK